MFNNKKLDFKHNIYFIYTCLFFAMGIIIFMPLLVRHNSFVAMGDCYNQSYPVLVYLSQYYREFISNLFHGKLAMYNTNIGFGDDIIGSLNYYGLGDVFSIIAAFFPKQYISYAYSFISILRLYCAGITFIVYGKYKEIPYKGLVIGSVMYTYSFCAIGLGFTFFSFNSILVFFPLIIYGIDLVLDERNNIHKVINVSSITA